MSHSVRHHLRLEIDAYGGPWRGRCGLATVHWHLKQIYQKLPISRQVDLVRLVLSIAEFG